MNNHFMNELPSYYQNIKEFQELSSTVVKDWDKLDEALFNIDNDQFILTSSEAAIAIRERDFGIRPDLQNETLKFRKLRLLARMQENAPQVLEYLIKILTDLLGENNHQILLDTDNFEMEVAVEVEQAVYYNEVIRIVERIVPLNIDLMTTLLALKDCLVILSGTYAWAFSNRICGRFKTASKPAVIGKEQLSVRDESYAFLVSARVCGRFRAGGIRI
ncbi:putative phage tail protein [Bacillus ndiopicus]|uniref:putative phage tail protein n=1 Tax=Bacillus ndiopicus TaxID=1347368 RepID=UPI0006943BBC|nr:putative phage tail protein [Bacillus ndiopicus]